MRFTMIISSSAMTNSRFVHSNIGEDVNLGLPFGLACPLLIASSSVLDSFFPPASAISLRRSGHTDHGRFLQHQIESSGQVPRRPTEQDEVAIWFCLAFRPDFCCLARGSKRRSNPFAAVLRACRGPSRRTPGLGPAWCAADLGEYRWPHIRLRPLTGHVSQRCAIDIAKCQ
jgi:hypothetical protein